MLCFDPTHLQNEDYNAGARTIAHSTTSPFYAGGRHIGMPASKAYLHMHADMHAGQLLMSVRTCRYQVL